MTRVVESALAHASAVVAKGQIVIGLSPADGLRRGERGGLHLLVFLAILAELELALGVVVGLIIELVFRLKHVVVTARVRLRGHLGGC